MYPTELGRFHTWKRKPLALTDLDVGWLRQSRNLLLQDLHPSSYRSPLLPCWKGSVLLERQRAKKRKQKIQTKKKGGTCRKAQQTPQRTCIVGTPRIPAYLPHHHPLRLRALRRPDTGKKTSVVKHSGELVSLGYTAACIMNHRKTQQCTLDGLRTATLMFFILRGPRELQQHAEKRA